MELWQSVAAGLVVQIIISAVAMVATVAGLRASIRYIEQRQERDQLQSAAEDKRLEKAIERANDRFDAYILDRRDER